MSATNVDEIIAQRIVDVMNRALAEDPQAIASLVNQRVACNDALANDPTIQVGTTDAGFDLGLLGILNGITGCPPYVAMVCDFKCEHGCDSTKEKISPRFTCPTCGGRMHLGAPERFVVIEPQQDEYAAALDARREETT
jgi:rRNA maturation protein Nop10